MVSGRLPLHLIPLHLIAVAAFVSAVSAGCTGSPIGDPCVPENIPADDTDGDMIPDGFDSREIYIETSSVQCRTRTCMVYQLEGNPEKISSSDPAINSCPAGDPTCVTQEQLNNQVFCSCRCSVPAGGQANTPLCACGSGFTCVDELVTTGGAGVVGGYCVPCRYDGDPRNLDSSVYDDCP
jgi:hypothetical protein